MTTILNTDLHLREIQEGFFICENSGQITDLLQQRPGIFADTGQGSDTAAPAQTRVSVAVTREGASFSVYFLVREFAGGEDSCWLLYVPNYLSKCFNLCCFSRYRPEVDVPALFGDMLKQFEQLFCSTRPALPVCCYCHPQFTGFVYDTDEVLHRN